MEEDEYKFRKYRQGDEAKIVELLQSSIDIMTSKGLNTIECLLTKGSIYETSLVHAGFVHNLTSLFVDYVPYMGDDLRNIIERCREDEVHITYSDFFVL